MSVKWEVLESTQLAAERGLKATFWLKCGDTHKNVYITAYDWDFPAVAVERVGERHLDPTLVKLKDVDRVEVHWR